MGILKLKFLIPSTSMIRRLLQSNIFKMQNHYLLAVCSKCKFFFILGAGELLVEFRQKPKDSKKEWPLDGGILTGTMSTELIITGHEDGQVRFWVGNGNTIKHIYRIKTSKLFDKTTLNSIDVLNPLAIMFIEVCIQR